jgi:hypothetical protein
MAIARNGNLHRIKLEPTVDVLAAEDGRMKRVRFRALVRALNSVGNPDILRPQQPVA